MKKTTANCQLPADNSRLIEMGVFSAPHGVRGQVKLRSYCEIPEDIASYKDLQDAQGKPCKLKLTGEAGDMLIVSVEGIADRNAAETLKNTKLYVPRTSLPKPRKGQYYYEDLRGIELFTKCGKTYGTILSVHDFGGGTLVNIRLTSGEEEYMPFNSQVFTDIDIQAARAVIDPPFIITGGDE